MIGLLAFIVFWAAVLLFSVQPMVAKMLLPGLGGAPAVWNTAVMFFQVVLVAAYALAHLWSRPRRVGWGVVGHVGLLGLAAWWLPVAVSGAGVAGDGLGWTTAPRLALMLAVGVGLPVLAVGVTGPLVQHWLARARPELGGRVYALSIASNAGSLIGLLAYPVVIEPRWTLAEQSRAWAVGFGLLALLMVIAGAWAAWRARRVTPGPQAVAATSVVVEGGRSALTWRARLTWLMCAAVPSSLSLAVTTHLTTDLAAVPMLWVLPLAVYLVTYVVAFSWAGPACARAARVALPVLAVLTLLANLLGAQDPLWLLMLVHLGVLAAGGLALHGRLAAERPGPEQVTEFYLVLAVGGALGSAANMLLAPVLFSGAFEYPLALAAACALAAVGVGASSWWWAAALAPAGLVWLSAWVWPAAAHPGAVIEGEDFVARLLFAGPPVVALYLLRRTPMHAGLAFLAASAVLAGVRGAQDLYRVRTFFGVHRVALVEGRHVLMHGTTVHGSQWRDAERKRTPLAYYHPSGPIGQVFLSRPTTAWRQVGLVGLGTGALAAYAGPETRLTIFEIDPAVVAIAVDPRLFTFLSDSPSAKRVVVGDGRVGLRSASGAERFDVLVVDAFSSDAIPMHLLTREAVREYVERLAEDGILALHLSNRHLNLLPVAAAIARAEGLAGRVGDDTEAPPAGLVREGKEPSMWVLLARRPETLRAFEHPPMWQGLPRGEDEYLWTDAFSNIWRVWR